MARTIVSDAEPCPFCGCIKMFQKIFSNGHKYGASVQCSKCHVDGPKVYTEYFDRLSMVSKDILDDLCKRSIEKWNHRPEKIL